MPRFALKEPDINADLVYDIAIGYAEEKLGLDPMPSVEGQEGREEGVGREEGLTRGRAAFYQQTSASTRPPERHLSGPVSVPS